MDKPQTYQVVITKFCLQFEHQTATGTIWLDNIGASDTIDHAEQVMALHRVRRFTKGTGNMRIIRRDITIVEEVLATGVSENAPNSGATS